MRKILAFQKRLHLASTSPCYGTGLHAIMEDIFGLHYFAKHYPDTHLRPASYLHLQVTENLNENINSFAFQDAYLKEITYTGNGCLFAPETSLSSLIDAVKQCLSETHNLVDGQEIEPIHSMIEIEIKDVHAEKMIYQHGFAVIQRPHYVDITDTDNNPPQKTAPDIHSYMCDKTLDLFSEFNPHHDRSLHIRLQRRAYFRPPPPPLKRKNTF